jgi:hypothetical protein
VNGTQTWTWAAAAAAVRGGAAPGLLAEGSRWYSMNVNCPPGGTKESAFYCAKRFNLCGRLGWSMGRRVEYEPDTRWKDGSVMVCELVNVRSRSGVPAGG